MKGLLSSRNALAAAVLLILIATACGQARLPSRDEGTGQSPGISKEQLDQARPEVRRAYNFALANRDILSKIPCYCGCVGEGHRSNLDCYIRETLGGDVELDAHGYG
ncbi:MAG: hypothetical protein HW403_484 [Dehalococcoidia bacterium]|nr:hypothetical protein [Dehalococcoidia bacterium]